MTYRTDVFVEGDMIIWFDDHYATLVHSRERYGDGPFEIQHIDPVNPRHYFSAGHTQHIVINVDNDLGWKRFSGAFFRKVD